MTPWQTGWAASFFPLQYKHFINFYFRPWSPLPPVNAEAILILWYRYVNVSVINKIITWKWLVPSSHRLIVQLPIFWGQIFAKCRKQRVVVIAITNTCREMRQHLEEGPHAEGFWNHGSCSLRKRSEQCGHQAHPELSARVLIMFCSVSCTFR